MSRTDKDEHRSDSFHTNHRDERKARPADRHADLVDRELAAEGLHCTEMTPLGPCDREVGHPGGHAPSGYPALPFNEAGLCVYTLACERGYGHGGPCVT